MEEKDSDMIVDLEMMTSMVLSQQPMDTTTDNTKHVEEAIAAQDGRVLCENCQQLHRDIKKIGSLQGPTDRKQMGTFVATLKFTMLADDCPFCIFWGTGTLG